MRLSRVRVLFGALSLIAVATGVQGAIASQIGVGGYVAGGGEVNQLTVTANTGTGAYTYTDSGVATISDLAGPEDASSRATRRRAPPTRAFSSTSRTATTSSTCDQADPPTKM